MKAHIHVNVHAMRQKKPAITIRLSEPLVGGDSAEVGLYRCRTVSWVGPTMMIQDDDRRLKAGARVWMEVDPDYIEWVDGQLPPWLPEAPKEEQHGEIQERHPSERDHPSDWRAE